MPTELLYSINFSFAITIASVGLIFGLLNIFLIIIYRQNHSVNNLLICDLCVSIVTFSLLFLIGCVYGVREDWYTYQPLCALRAYITMIAVIATSYSFLIQAISRLFFAVFYKHRFLLSWRTHWILIVLKWFLSILISIEPFFIEHGFGLSEEYRMCVITTKVLSVTLYSCIIGFMFPVSIIIIVYSVILYQAHQSTRRVVPVKAASSTSMHSSTIRNLKVMQNMLILLNILMCGGIPYLILILWYIIQPQSVAQELYLLASDFATLATTLSMITLFFKNKIVKDNIPKQFLRRPQP